MKFILKSTAILSLLSTFITIIPVIITTPALSRTTKPQIPTTPPNEVLEIARKSGNCPQTVGLWIAFRYYEGGGETTVIANTSPIARTVKLVASGKKFVEYKGPLKKAYASCVASASKDNTYFVSLQKGQISFRVVLPKDTPSNPSGFSLRTLVDSRPYVKWQIAD